LTNIKVRQFTVLLGFCSLLSVSHAAAHTIDILELPNGGGTRAVIDGNILNTFPGSETISVGANLNDGLYVPQILNVNIYADAAHMIVSDELTITVPAQNPGQITVGLTSETPGLGLQPLTPEDIGLTEIAGLQTITTLTNSNRVQTTIRFQSDDAPSGPAPAVPEPSSFALVGIAIAGVARIRGYKSSPS
jgi:hypothetical protein